MNTTAMSAGAGVEYVDPCPGMDDDAQVWVPCWKCGGHGVISSYYYIEAGRCFACARRGASGEYRSAGSMRRAAQRLARRAVKRAREAAEQAAKAERERVEFAETHADVVAAVANMRGQFGDDMRATLAEVGRLTDAQVEAVRRIAAERAAEPERAPVVAGRITVTGRVMSVKSRKTPRFGMVHKMIVQDDRGFRVHGSVPQALQVDDDGAIHGGSMVRGGERVTFTATVEPSD